MNNLSVYEELDQSINALLAGNARRAPSLETLELLSIADELRLMPAQDFRARLAADLAEAAVSVQLRNQSADPADILPTLFGRGAGVYPIHRASFAAPVLLHSAALALIVFSSAWLVQNRHAVSTQIISLVNPSSYALPVASDQSHGGGGGGDRDRLEASKGQPPRFAREQITPPMAVLRNESPKLVAEPAVVGPPSITFPTSIPGVPSSKTTLASNGTGSGGGIGSGEGGGVGEGNGPGVGPGTGGGIGGGIFVVGGGVSAPRAIFDPDPDYSEEARKAHYQGVVALHLIVDAKGKPRDIRVQRSLGMGLDQKAIEAVSNWRFQPAMKDGRPVAVQIMVEVNFHLY